MSKKWLAVLFVFFIAGYAKRSSAEENSITEIKAVRTSQPPVIDGKLDDHCWQKSAKISRFMNVTRGIPLEKNWTTAYILYDDEALYFGFLCNHPDIKQMLVHSRNIGLTERDQEVCSDDSVEIFLDPGHTAFGYFHFMINSKGILYDAVGTQGGNVYNATWNAEFPFKAKIYDDHWILETAIPYAVLNLPLEISSTWGINMARNMPWVAPPGAAFYTGKSFHAPEKFGLLTGVNVDFSRYFYILEDIRLGGFLNDEGREVVQLQYSIRNLTGKPQDNTVEAELTSMTTGARFTEKTQLNIPPVEMTGFSISFLNAPADKYELSLAVKDKQGKIAKVFLERMESQSSCSELAIIYPFYRNAFYATMENQTLKSYLKINASSAIAGKIVYDYEVADDGGKIILCKRNASFPPGSNLSIISFDTRELSYGKYQLKTILTLSGKHIGENTVTFNRYPPFPSEARIAPDGMTVVNGKRFFPIGLIGINPFTAKTGDIDAIASAGFNTISSHEWEPEWLDEIAKRDLKVFIYDGDMWMPWAIKEYANRIPIALEKVKNRKSHPAVLAYYFSDEPDLHATWSLEGLVEGYGKMKETDPYHPVKPVVSNCGAYYQKIYRSFTDILGIDPYLYPRYDDPESNIKNLKGVIGAISAAVEVGKNSGQPVWVDPQIFDTRAWEQRDWPGEIFPGRLPYLKEQRYTVYRSIIEGVKGFLFWSWFHDYANPHFNPAGWEFLRALAGEMNYLHEALVSEEKITAQATSQDKDISLRVFSHRENVYLIAANDSSKTVRTNIKFRNTNARRLYVLSENRTVTLRKSDFWDTFEPFGVHIYTDKMVPKGMMVMEKMLKDPLFSEEPVKDKDPENLCWEGNGAKIASSHKYFSFTDSPVFAIDGDIRTSWFTRRWGPFALEPASEENDWLKVDFPEEKEVKRIEIISWLPRYYPDPVNVLSDYEIQYLHGTEWKTLVKNENNKKEKIVHSFSPVRTKSIKLVVTKGLYVAELKAYAH